MSEKRKKLFACIPGGGKNLYENGNNHELK